MQKQKTEIQLASEKMGIKLRTIYRRLYVLGWDKEIALTTPLTTPRSYKKILKKRNTA